PLRYFPFAQSHRSPQLHLSPHRQAFAHWQVSSCFSEQQLLLFFFWLFMVFLLSHLLTDSPGFPYTRAGKFLTVHVDFHSRNFVVKSSKPPPNSQPPHSIHYISPFRLAEYPGGFC